MVAATSPVRRNAWGRPRRSDTGARPAVPTVALFRGCVMDALFSHVHDATRRTLRGQRLPGDRGRRPGLLRRAARARRRPDRRVRPRPRESARPSRDAADYIVVNSAGLRRAAQGLRPPARQPPRREAFGAPRAGRDRTAGRARAPAGRVHSISTWRTMRPATCSTPSGCTRRRSRCSARSPACGSSCCRAPTGAVAARGSTPCSSPRCRARCSTPRSRRSPRPAGPIVVATGNPGCLMQIGAGLRAAGLPIRVAHPVELLDWSYQAGGVYG